MSNEKGFSMIEMISVLVIIGILALMFVRMPLELITLSRETSYNSDIYYDTLLIRKALTKDLKNIQDPRDIDISGRELTIGKDIKYISSNEGLTRRDIELDEDKMICDRKDLTFKSEGDLIVINNDNKEINLKLTKSYSSFQRNLGREISYER